MLGFILKFFNLKQYILLKMIKKINFSSLFKVLFISMLFASCGDGVHEKGNGTVTEETRNVGAFFNLDIDGDYEIVLQEGSTPLITVQTDENLHQYVETKLDGQTLKVRNVEKIQASENTRLIITYQKIEDIILGGAAKVENRGVINSDELNIRVNGSGVIDLSINVRELELKLGGAGSVNLRGKAEKQKMELSGAGNLAALELESKECEVNLSGIGSAQVFVTDNLKAEVSGVGSIRFKGDPRNISREVSGLGDIERVE